MGPMVGDGSAGRLSAMTALSAGLATTVSVTWCVSDMVYWRPWDRFRPCTGKPADDNVPKRRGGLFRMYPARSRPGSPQRVGEPREIDHHAYPAGHWPCATWARAGTPGSVHGDWPDVPGGRPAEGAGRVVG